MVAAIWRVSDMKRTKDRQRRCDWPACGKLYRHSDPRSRTCSAAYRMRLYRARKKAKERDIAVKAESILRTMTDCEICRFGVWLEMIYTVSDTPHSEVTPR